MLNFRNEEIFNSARDLSDLIVCKKKLREEKVLPQVSPVAPTGQLQVKPPFPIGVHVPPF